MFVYVNNKHGQPLMPCAPRKARVLLKQGKASVVRREPFTIRLLYGSSGYTQEVALGVDAGSQVIGISATTENQVVLEAEVHLRTDTPTSCATRCLQTSRRPLEAISPKKPR